MVGLLATSPKLPKAPMFGLYVSKASGEASQTCRIGLRRARPRARQRQRFRAGCPIFLPRRTLRVGAACFESLQTGRSCSSGSNVWDWRFPIVETVTVRKRSYRLRAMAQVFWSSCIQVGRFAHSSVAGLTKHALLHAFSFWWIGRFSTQDRAATPRCLPTV